VTLSTIQAVVIWALATGGVTLASVFGILFFSFRAPGGSLIDQVRSARYVAEYEGALEWLGVRGRERRAHVAELRANLADAALDGGMRGAIERLGAPKDLARDVASSRTHPTWAFGFALMFTTWLALQLLLLAAAQAFSAGVVAVGDPGQTASGTGILGTSFETTLGADGLQQSLSATSTWPFAAIPIAVLIVSSRFWRVGSRRHAAEPATT
jgi:hypothetical protein